MAANHTNEESTPNCTDCENGNGHFFIRKTFHKPTYCHHCTDMLWGLRGQGYVCEVCNFVVHDKCLAVVASSCSGMGSNVVKNPVAHCWSEPGHFKRKFCNLCRKRLEDSWAIRCEICEYYAHLECQDFVVSDCKEAATFIPNCEKISSSQSHHWREGNLPGNSKCLHCKKTCWSAECLTGMRCEWCGATAHAGCYRSLPLDCSFGCLREIMLPPSCISVPDMDVSMETIYRFQKKPAQQGLGSKWSGVSSAVSSAWSWLAGHHSSVAETLESSPTTTSHEVNGVTEDMSSTGDSRTDFDDERKSTREKEGKDKDRDRDEEIIRIFDGNSSLKRRVYRTVTIPKGAPAQVLLEAALRTFHISDDSRKYYLAETTETESGEKELDNNQPIRGQITSRDGRRASVYLRYRDKDTEKGHIIVFPGRVVNRYRDDNQQNTDMGSKHIPVTLETQASQVVENALKAFGGLADEDPEKFQLLEMCLDKGVHERLLEDDEKPWLFVQHSRKESLRQSRLTRFYVKPKEIVLTDEQQTPSQIMAEQFGGNLPPIIKNKTLNCNQTHIAIYVGNLPTGLSQKQYEKILVDIIGKENRWLSYDIIYHDYGAVVLIYNSTLKATAAFYLLENAVLDKKSLQILILPLLQPHMIPDYVTPLLVLVNVKSGGQQGMDLIRSFRKLLNPHQVYDLMNGGPLPGLYVFRNIPYFRIMVCGGDGTVGWALSCLDNVGQDAKCSSPPMAIIPLGTGNDLARVLRWGPGYSGGEDPLNLLRDVIDAEEIKLDRWTVIFHPNETEPDEIKRGILHDTNAANTNEDTSSIFLMNNYFGIGLDADLALDFHNAREENPDKFNSRIHNKGVYLKMGLRKMLMRGTCKNLHRVIRLEVDSKVIELPPLEGIIILNIASWAGGNNLWGPEKEDHFAKPTHYDGMLEVVAVTGVVHIGQMSSGLRSAVRIAQGGHLRITTSSEVPVQVDGEPWIQPAGQIVVLRSALKATMLKKSKNKIKRRNTEPNIYFPNEPSVCPQSPSGDGEGGPL